MCSEIKINRTKLISSFIWLLIVVLGNKPVFSLNTCVDCHKTLDEKNSKIVEDFKKDIHFQRGLSCNSCHGGNPKIGMESPWESMNPDQGFVGVPNTTEIPQFCGRCHSDVEYMKKYNPKLRVDQDQLYKTSVHGKRLRLGDKKVATCVSCHGVHQILPVSDPNSPVFDVNVPHTCATCHANVSYMQSYKIPTNQFEEYSQSIHGELLLNNRDRSAPACNDCHGNHGATPPGLGDIASACGECHANNRDLFDSSPHKQAFKDNGFPECVTCHDHHLVMKTSDDMLGIGDKAICSNCHLDPESKPYQTALQLKARLDSLKNSIQLAQNLVEKAEKAGVDVAKAKFELNLAKDDVIKIQSLIHSVSLERVSEVVTEGMSKAQVVQKSGQEALFDLKLRRIGLGGSAVIILILAWGLYLKIKDLDSRSKPR